MAKIKIVILDDLSIMTFEQKPRECFIEKYKNEHSVNYHFNKQQEDFEENLLSKFKLDIEAYAKSEYNLIHRREQKTVDDFDDDDIEGEYISRGLGVNEYIENENIINESFTARLAEIVNRGNDLEIDEALEVLEKKYRIK
jgi:hypothetical protein